MGNDRNVEIASGDEGERLLTSHEVGELLQVNPSSVNKWVNEGRITAFRTPGGHRRIRMADLLDFLRRHKMPIPKGIASSVRRRVMIVYDNARNLKALDRLMKLYASQIQLSLISNGIDALVKVGTLKPDVMMIDVLMSGLDGVEVCRRLKANPETERIDVLITSGHLTRELEKRAFSAGARACLRKPVPLETLLIELGVVEHARTT